jgi:hypothetical protein
MTVKLPRRLHDREPDRNDPPSEADWLRRAIHHCEYHSSIDEESPYDASLNAYARRDDLVPHERFDVDGRDNHMAGWLPEHLRRVPLAELRTLLAALDTPQDNP